MQIGQRWDIFKHITVLHITLKDRIGFIQFGQNGAKNYFKYSGNPESFTRITHGGLVLEGHLDSYTQTID